MKVLFENWRKYQQSLLQELEAPPAQAAAAGGGGEDPRAMFNKADYATFVNWLGTNIDDPKTQAFLKAGLKDGQRPDDVFAVSDAVAIPVVKLSPTQNEIGVGGSLVWPLKKNIEQFIKYAGATEPILPPGKGGASPIVTFDGKWVIDGHHRWSTLYACNAKAAIICYNITTKTDISPMHMLKAVQVAIAKSIGKVPKEQAAGANLLTVGEQAVGAWINQNLNIKLIPLIKQNAAVSAKVFGQAKEVAEQRRGAEMEPDILALTNYIWGNVSVMQQSAKPAPGAPKRGFMPQTDYAPDWGKQLKGGEIDFFEPYAKAKEA